MRKKIINYDDYFKDDFNATLYCDIALENYFLTKDIYCEILKSDNKCSEYVKQLDNYRSKQIICTVFSQMCIESILNDYIADYLSKKEIDSFFDKLPIQDKLKFIAKFILNRKIKTDGVLFNYLKLMISNRNSNIHNKSKLISFEQLDKMEKEFGNQKLDENDFKEIFILAKQSIMAIIEIAKFLNNPSKDIYILEMLFIGEYGNEKQTQIRDKAINEFNIRLDSGI